MHILFNPGPLTLIVALDGSLMDAQTRMTADPDERCIARLLKRHALVDLGPASEPEPEQP